MKTQGFARCLCSLVFAMSVSLMGCSSSSGGDGGSSGTGGAGGEGGGGAGGGGAVGGQGGTGGLGGVGGGPPEAVTAEPPGVPFTPSITVTLSTESGEPIYYTTDLTPVLDGDGNVQGTEYTAPITLVDTTVLKFLTGTEGDYSPEQAEGYVFESSQIRGEWARSGHGNIADTPWRRWDASGSVSTSCSKCHGPKNDEPMDAPDVGMLEYLATGEITVPSPLPLGLDCTNCHQTFLTIYSDLAKFGLPNGKLEPIEFPSTDEVSLYGPSNICMVCHQGRESGKDVQDEIDASEGPYSFLNIHYYAAAATFFGNETLGGYEYAGLDYRPRNTFPSHPDSFSTCVGCHMQNAPTNPGEPPQKHLFIPGEESCIGCHGGTSFETLGGTPSMSYDNIETLSPELYSAIEAYADDVIGVPIEYRDAYPYFFNADTGEGYSDFDATLLPAAYNYQVVQKDPAGFIHNGAYLQQLLFDSIGSLGAVPSIEVIGRATLTIDGSNIGSASKTEQWWLNAHGALDTEPFRHWDNDYEPDGYTPSGIPGSCTRCHSTGGFVEYAAGTPTTGQLPVTGVDCWACHNEFNLFEDAATRYDDLEANPALASIVFPSGATASLDNASNICVGCHQGRASKVQVDDATPNNVVQMPTDYPSFDFINIHYYAAGATLFGSDVMGGYEYDADTAGDPLSYRGRTPFASIHVDTADGRNLIDCVGCHMNSSLARNPPSETDTVKHTFLPIVQDCNQCHAGDSFQTMNGTPATNYANIQILKEDLLNAIVAYSLNGLPQPSEVFYDASSYPYWFKAGGPASFPNRYRDFNFDMLTAAYNFVTGDRDPGGYIHNGLYIQELLFDSICLMGGTPRVLTIPTRTPECPAP